MNVSSVQYLVPHAFSAAMFSCLGVHFLETGQRESSPGGECFLRKQIRASKVLRVIRGTGGMLAV